MSALRANPAPLLPSHVGVVIGLAVAKNLNSFSLQLFHRPRHVIRAETEVMNMLPHLFQAIAKRSAGAGLNELNFGRMIVDEGGPIHALVFATGKFVIFTDALLERRGIENPENFSPKTVRVSLREEVV